MKKYLFIVTLLILACLTLPMLAQEDMAANKAVVTRFIEEVWNGGDLTVANEIIHENFVAHFTNSPDEDWEAYVANTWTPFRSIFPDITVKPTVMMADGDMVAMAGRWGGTFSGGEDMGLSPTDQEVWVSSVEFYRVEDGRIAEFWDVSNMRSYDEQVGVVDTEGEVQPEVAWDVSLEPTNILPEERRLRLLEDTLAVNSFDVDQVVEDYTPDATLHWIPMGVELEGSAALRESWEMTPPQHRLAPRLIVAEGNLTATLYTMFPYVEGVPGLRTEMAVLNRFEGDKMAEEWAIWDDVALMAQITGDAE